MKAPDSSLTPFLGGEGRLPAAPPAPEIEVELRRRLRGPQRHRLLHGYPMAPLMETVPAGFDPWPAVELDPSRPLLIGVIPHTMCNPSVRGCGFCTFPHERFHRDRAHAVVGRVLTEIESTVRARPELLRRRVDAVYFGGGTANLTPTADLAWLGESLARSFSLESAEHTLEGAPVYFGTRGGETLAAFASATGARRLRISMGIQTFDEARLAQMGRLHLGRREHVERALAVARRLDATTSGDLLINQPGQTLSEMLADVRTAIALGLDQICIYHLVMFARLGTVWSGDAGRLASLPHNERAFEQWSQVRALLLDNGYVQRTLTNFERAQVPPARRFIYEENSFHPEVYDAIGFGPAGISTLGARHKWCNADTAADYIQRIDHHRRAIDRTFTYDPADRALLYVTRTLPLMEVALGSLPPGTVDVEALWALEEAGLLHVNEDLLVLTPRGMFFADTVAGLLAWRRAQRLREGLDEHAVHASMMG